jgi:hypothetical protein
MTSVTWHCESLYPPLTLTQRTAPTTCGRMELGGTLTQDQRLTTAWRVGSFTIRPNK